MNNNFFTIAIDGGSASGKTTGSKFIAKNFGFKLLSSGKLYRYLALSILKNKKYSLELQKNFSNLRLTLDTEYDLYILNKLFKFNKYNFNLKLDKILDIYNKNKN